MSPRQSDVTGPDVTEPDVAEPNVTEPNVTGPDVTVVVPTIGRPSLAALLRSLAASSASTAAPPLAEVVVVDDRRGRDVDPLVLPADLTSLPVRVVRSFGHGPAAARNLGWRLARTGWVAFLDDDVVVPPDWNELLAADLAAAPAHLGGTQGRLHVPGPVGRAPTDVERGTLGLTDAAWATADMAYRRTALQQVAGFDERFPRAFREDADLAIRVLRAGWTLERGRRTTIHPLRPPSPGDATASVRAQRGNADDALMRALHGRSWRRVAQAPTGRLPLHVATVTAGLIGLTALGEWAVLRTMNTANTAETAITKDTANMTRTVPTGHRASQVAALAAAGWLALTTDFAARRIRPGPRHAAEVRAMLLTSIAIPPVAVAHRVRGWWRSRGAHAWPVPAAAVLFDRDGTLVHDVPYNGDPALVDPVTGAADAVAQLRAAGLRVGVVTNQSGIARGLVTPGQVDAVNTAVDAHVGPFDTWQVCPHGPDDACGCRKPAPGMVLAAATELGVPAREVVVIGDIGADVEAARAAGARGILVPTPLTRPQEVADAPFVATGLAEAVAMVLST